MNILITGAGGLIGFHLLNHLKQNHKLFSISNSINEKNNLEIDFSKDWDEQLLPKNIDCIIHLAQSPHFRDFPKMGNEIFYTNTLSTMKLISWAQKKGIKKFIFASSAGIYGNSNDAFSEEQEIVYKSQLGFYLATKHCSEIILDNYSNLIDVIQLRFFFVYGNGQKKDMLIPRLVENVKTNVPITLQGENGIKLNPIHVSDAVLAIEKSIDLNGSHKINVGGNEILSLKQIGDIIGDELKLNPNYLIEPTTPKHLIGNITKMKNKLNIPKIKFREGIKKIIENGQ